MVPIKDLKSNPVITEYLVGVSFVYIITGVTLTNKRGPRQQISSPAQCEPSQQQISARAFAQVCKRNAGNILLLIVTVLCMCLCVIFLSVKASFSVLYFCQLKLVLPHSRAFRIQLLPGVELKDMIETNEWPTNLHL